MRTESVCTTRADGARMAENSGAWLKRIAGRGASAITPNSAATSTIIPRTVSAFHKAIRVSLIREFSGVK
jgi:hypothetical protein